MRGGIAAVRRCSPHSRLADPHRQITLPAGYLGSSLIGASLVTCVSRSCSLCDGPGTRRRFVLVGLRHRRIESRKPRPSCLLGTHRVVGKGQLGRMVHHSAHGRTHYCKYCPGRE